MNTDKLVRMANQIAEYFASYPEAEAQAGIRDHIVAFWTPRMVTALETRAAENPTGLLPLAATAMRRPTTAQNPAQNPAEKTTASPIELGALASDAG